MDKSKLIQIIGSASGIGAQTPDSAMGPVIMQGSDYLNDLKLDLEWLGLFYANDNQMGLAALPAITQLCERIANQTYQLTLNKQPFVVIGGDQTCSIGTWSGATAALSNQGPLGLVWVDAHMDSHTFETTESQNLHGMALACLMGYGEPPLTHIFNDNVKIQPEHVCLIGVRRFESDEAELLKKLKVHIFFMEEVQQRGIDAVIEEALSIVNQGTKGYGVSFDLDAIDPQDAPGVNERVPNGIDGKSFCNTLRQFNSDPRLVGIDIVEFNPNGDQQCKTEKMIADIIAAIYC